MTGNKPFVFGFADVEVHEREFCLRKAGEVLPIEPKAFRVLLHLLHNPQKLIPKEELLNAVWGDASVTENSLARAIALLRKVLGDDHRNARYIETVSTVGYRFVCKVEALEDSSGDFEATDVLSGRNRTEARDNVAVAVASIAPPSKTDKEFREGSHENKRRILRSRWLLAGTAIVVCAVAGFWYLRRPLPPPRITAYSQITYDGARKTLIGTDGSRLYFDSGSTNSIDQVAVTGGAISTIPVSVADFAFPEDVSPDGANFLIATNEKGYSLDRPQWNIRLPEGSRRRLPDGGSAAFSPDGNSVAYQTGEGGLWVARSDGSNAHKLTSGQSVSLRDIQSYETSDRFSFGRIAWSPDGSVLRFENGGRLWEISTSGTHLHEVIPGWHLSSNQCCGSWTPDGRDFVFLDTPIGLLAQSEIWVLSEHDGPLPRPHAQPVRLMAGPIAWGQPIPSRDGKRIFATGRTRRGELVRFDSKTRQFEPFLGGISAHFVSFSNDGQFVAYVSYPAGILWSANRDGSNPVQLTEPPIHALSSRWSPDGSQILFSDFGATPPAVYVVAARGGIAQRLPGNPEPLGDANWSADGKDIVFSTTGPFNRKGNLFILEVATQKVTAVAGSEGLFSPRWSPDGRLIAAMPIDGTSLKVFNLETQQWSVLIQKGKFGFPSWSRDSQFIYFLGAVNGDSGFLRIRVGGGHPERVTDLNGIHLGGGWSWIGLDASDAPMVMRDVGSDDIYALTLERK